MNCILPISLFARAPWQFSTGMESYVSDSNYDSDGNEYIYCSNCELYQFKTKHKLNFMLSNKWKISAGGNIFHGQSIQSNEERDNTQLTEFIFGAEYYFINNKFLMSAELNQNIPVFTYDDTTDEVLLSSGAFETTLKLNMATTFKYFGLVGSLGYQYRTEGLADLALYKLEGQFIILPFVIGLGVDGFWNVTDDDYTNNVSKRTDVTNRVNGGSLEYYSVNPSATFANIWAAYYFSPQVSGSIGYRITNDGKNYAKSEALTIGLNIGWGGVKSYDDEVFSVGDSEEIIIKTNYDDEEQYFRDMELEKQKEQKRTKKKNSKKEPFKSKKEIEYELMDMAY